LFTEGREYGRRENVMVLGGETDFTQEEEKEEVEKLEVVVVEE
jgi:hypothetical protein